MTNEKFNIICLSNQLWDYPLPTNKRHVMSRLAKLGHTVLFVDPPINTGRLFARQILRGQWSLKRLATQTYMHEDVLVYTPLNSLPNGDITSKMHADRISSLAGKHLDPNKRTILWVYHVETPGLQNYLDLVSRDLLIYDCVDNYAAFPDNSLFYSATVGKDQIIAQEKALTEQADLVFATAPGLVDKLKKYTNEVHYTPNVGNYPKFKVTPNLKDKIPEDIKSIRRPRIGFTGAVDEYKFDKELVKYLAKKNPNYSFVIIGPLALKDREATNEELGFEGFDNVYFLGSRPYSKMESYYAGFDAFIIPFQLNDYTVGGCFPIKFHDALAAGLATVVTDLPAYAPFKDVSYIAKSKEEFSDLIAKALKEDSKEHVEARQMVAKENDWDVKVDKMLNLIYTEINKNP